MIVVKLQGGLGNQMFQYALGKKLSIKYKTKLFLDVSFYKKNKEKKIIKRIILLLKEFLKSGSIVKAVKIVQANNRNYKLFVFRLNDHVEILNKSKLVEVKECDEFIYNQALLDYGDNFSYMGYFNSEKYFWDISGIIKEDFILKNDYKRNIIDRENEIKHSNSVSIHIRRGDYISNRHANKMFYICEMDYYISAIKTIKKLIPSPIFFIFSDDIDWCKKNFPHDNNFKYIEGNDNYQDLYLMSICKHNIIANSTFSWWSAWLNDNNKKIIIAPRKWIKNLDITKTDLLPDKWIKI